MSPVAIHPGGTLPHYQLGDLGLIPRPKQHIPTSFEQMRVLSATTRLGNLKKVLTRSVAVQTVSAPKVNSRCLINFSVSHIKINWWVNSKVIIGRILMMQSKKLH